MKLHVKSHPDYFGMLDFRTCEFRQFKSIVIENSETGEKREFLVKDVRKIYPTCEETIKKKYPKARWDEELPVYAIDLGDELDRNDELSVTVPNPGQACQDDRKVFEIPVAEKTWHAVG